MSSGDFYTFVVRYADWETNSKWSGSVLKPADGLRWGVGTLSRFNEVIFQQIEMEIVEFKF